MLRILDTTQEVLVAAAEYFVNTATEAIHNSGGCTVALSGGSSPKGLFEMLAADYREKVEWEKLFFFFGDERYVPADHPDSNALMAAKALFEPLGIAQKQIFTIDTSLPAEAAASAYEESIFKHFAPDVPRFDLILLGMGDDAHTASLFPYTNVLNATDPGVRAIFIEEKQVYRITFTAPLINLAKHIAFLVFGQSKAKAARRVLQGERDGNQYPAQLVNPGKGDVTWFMDRSAAALLTQ